VLDGTAFFDPLAAALLLARPRLGVMLTVANIPNDVVLNAWVGATRGFQVGAFVAQSLLLAFVLATARLARPQRCSPGVFARTMTMGFPTDATEPWGRARLSLKSMLYARLRCHVGGERTLCG
jgi:hypothetical protein